jgi:hypothetical protein
LAEVSGLACLHRAGGALLVAVGDNDASLATADVGADGAIGEWRVVTADELGARPDASVRFRQLEAVAVDGGGRAWVVTEGTSLLGGIDLGAGAVVGGASLDTATLPELDRHWRLRDASRSEGLLLLVRGHLLVVKEKDPAGLVEFGPAGEDPLGVSAATLLPADAPFALPAAARDGQPPCLVALAWWPLPKRIRKSFADLSDLAMDGSAGVWVLSDKSRRIGRLGIPLAPGDEVDIEPFADLPQGIGKPEGLALLPGGLIAVSDDRKDERDNLWVFRAPEP